MHAPGTPADRKHSDSFLAPLERALVARLMPLIPGWIHTQHLTLMTIVWTLQVVGASALARRDSRWMWAVSVAIAFQYLTDAIDGKVGKLRGDGLVRWGYYMDHLLDYAFLSAILIGYMLLLPGEHQYLMMLALAVSAGFMAS